MIEPNLAVSKLIKVRLRNLQHNLVRYEEDLLRNQSLEKDLRELIQETAKEINELKGSGDFLPESEEAL